MRDTWLGDVVDLTWMVTAPLDLHAVQELLERVVAVVFPGVKGRFSTYDEPRYRSALQLHLGDTPARAAFGGVLAGWQGRPDGVDAALVRIFPERWVTR